MFFKKADDLPDYTTLRAKMVSDQLVKRGIKNSRVLEIMGKIPREEFVPEHLKNQAYQDSPLSIGSGQTISQPFMVAVMTEALSLKGGERVLEIGTGSGYQAAVLAEIAEVVVTIERIPELQADAKKTLDKLGYKNIKFISGDGTLGYPDFAPFDGIIVTAAAPYIPETLQDQLSMAGTMVIPVGSRIFQECLKITRNSGGYSENNITGCTFVPLLGKKGW